jgi:hypothetical protein
MDAQKFYKAGLTGDGVKIQGTVNAGVDMTTTNTKLDTLHSDIGSTNTKLDTGNADKGVIATATFTRPDNATPYAINDVVGTDAATNMSFSIGANSVLITQATLKIKVNAVPAGMSGFKLHLFKSAPTAITDNSAFNIIAADIDNYIGYIQFDLPSDFGDNLFSQSVNLSYPALAAVATLFGVLTTDTACTPSSQNVFSVSIRGVKCI